MRLLPLAAVMLLAGQVAHADGSAVRQAHVATLANQLRLDATAAERTQTVVDKFKARMAPLVRADVALLGQLRTELALSVPDARRMKALSGELVKNRLKLQALRDDRLRELQKTLTSEQFSRLLLRWPTITRQFRREARRAPRG